MKLTDLISNIKYKDILEKYNYNWKVISRYAYLSEEFTEYYKDKLDWYLISKCQKLNESFMVKYKNYLHWPYISAY